MKINKRDARGKERVHSQDASVSGNSSQLRGALRNGFIPYDIGYGGQFYNAEKLILGNKGLSPQGNIWIK